MATNRWAPTAQKIAQTTTVTIGVYDATTTYTITINNKAYSTLGTGGTASTTATALEALVAASTEGEYLEITWSVGAAVITALAKTAGVPFTLTASVSGGTGTISSATTVANSSPNDINNINNWSLGAVPVNTNDVIFDAGNVSALYNLSALSGVTLNSLTRRNTYTGKIGLPEYNANGYFEYRATELAIGASTFTNEQATGDAAAQVKFNAGAVATTLVIRGQSAGVLGQEATWFRGTSASNVANLMNASVAVAPVNANAATLTTTKATNSVMRCGSGCTLTTMNITNTTLEVNGNVTTLNQYGNSSKSYIKGTAALTTTNIYGGTYFHQSTGSFGTPTVGSGGILDFSTDTRTRSAGGTISLAKGATINDPAATIATTPTIAFLDDADPSNTKLILGPGRSITISV